MENSQRALALREAAGDKIGQAVSHEELARLFILQGKPEDAMAHLRAAEPIAEVGVDPKLSADVIRTRASAYMSLGKFQAAVADYSQAIRTFQELNDARSEADAAFNLGWAHQSMGEIPKTLSSYDRALKIYANLGDEDGQVRVRMAAGSLYASLGEPIKALLQYRAGWGTATDTQRAWMLASNAEILIAENEPKSALQYYSEARRLMSPSTKPVTDCCSVAVTAQDSLNLSAALGTESLISKLRGGATHQGDGFLGNVGDVHFTGHTDAGSFAAGAEVKDQKIPEVTNQEKPAMDASFDASTLAGMARAELMVDHLLVADGFGESALLKMREAKNRSGEAGVLAILGEVHLRQSIEAPSTPTRDELVEYYQFSRNTSLSSLHYPVSQPDDPHRLFKLAQLNLSKSLSIMRELGDRSGETGVLADTGMLYDAWGKRNEALSYYLQALNNLEELQTSARLEEFRINLAEQASALYQRTTALELSLHKEEQGFNLSERARSRALLDQLGNPKINLSNHAPANFATKEEALRGENIALRRRLAEEMAKPAGEIDQERVSSIQSRLAVIHKQYQDLITQLKLSNPEYASFLSVSPLTIAELQAQLGADVTLVSYYTTPSVNVAFVITQHEFRAVKLPATEAQISAATATLLDFAGEQNSPSLTHLYKWLIAPIRSQLKTPLLAIAPYGVLHDLPFAALTADGKRYLNDDYTIFLLPSASAWPYVRARTKPASGHALIMANDHVGGQTTLPHAYEEAQAVASLLGTIPRLGDDASRDLLLSAAGQAEFLHLIGHISSDREEPGFSEVAVGGSSTDGPLQLNDVLNLDLDKTNLVVLSGCQSNSGVRSRADDVSSLSSAFLYAGTPTVVASLWNVNDAATKELMVAFYSHLKDGVGKAEALRAAQKDVRQNRPNPYYWAGFVLTGDPGSAPSSAFVARSNK
jgi:CHAT domain-containing protein